MIAVHAAQDGARYERQSSSLVMKKLLLAGVAALFLLSGTAQAYPPEYLKCGQIFVRIQTGKGTAPDGTRVFPRDYTIREDGMKGANMETLRSFGCNDKTCWLNRRPCRHMTSDEWFKQFPEDEDAPALKDEK